MKRKQFIELALASEPRDCVLWPYAVRKSSGYPAFSKKLNGTTVNHDAHRLVCELAHGASSKQAAHSCGNKLCINPHHLYWATSVENMADAKRHGTLRGGGRYRQRIFSEQRADIKSSSLSLSEIAQKYAITVSDAGKIRRTA